MEVEVVKNYTPPKIHEEGTTICEIQYLSINKDI